MTEGWGSPLADHSDHHWLWGQVPTDLEWATAGCNLHTHRCFLLRSPCRECGQCGGLSYYLFTTNLWLHVPGFNCLAASESKRKKKRKKSVHSVWTAMVHMSKQDGKRGCSYSQMRWKMFTEVKPYSCGCS